MIDGVFDGSLKSGSTFPSVLNLVGKTLQDSTEYGFGGMLADADFKTPDGEMLLRLTKDVWQFSAAKNYNQLRDMTLALTDAEGNMRSYGDFKEAATAINEKYNNAWLKTEYNLAVNSSTMAARWVDFEKNKADMPFLQYSSVGDGNVRPEHQVLNGIIRKVDDSFWNTHYPPNGWNCRCDVRQLATSYAQETVGLPDIVIPSMFRTNLAKTGLVFPEKSAYYDGLSKADYNRALADNKVSSAYQNVYTSELTGKTVELHILHGTAEAPRNIETAKLLADNGHNVKLLPILVHSDDDIRKAIYGTKEFVAGKNPDALVDNRLFDFKNSTKATKSAIHNAIEEGNHQGSRVVIHLPEKMDEAEIKRHVKGKMNQATYLDETWVLNQDKELFKYNLKSLGLPEKAKRPTK